MIAEMNFNFWLSILSILFAGFPWLFLFRYERRTGNPVDKERFKKYRDFEFVWLVLYGVGLAYVYYMLNFDKDSVNFVAIMGMFLSLIAMPSALLAGFTGVYREIGAREMVRGHYEIHKNPRRQFFAWTNVPTMKVIGWTQFFLLAIVLVISISTL